MIERLVGRAGARSDVNTCGLEEEDWLGNYQQRRWVARVNNAGQNGVDNFNRAPPSGSRSKKKVISELAVVVCNWHLTQHRAPRMQTCAAPNDFF